LSPAWEPAICSMPQLWAWGQSWGSMARSGTEPLSAPPCPRRPVMECIWGVGPALLLGEDILQKLIWDRSPPCSVETSQERLVPPCAGVGARGHGLGASQGRDSPTSPVPLSWCLLGLCSLVPLTKRWHLAWPRAAPRLLSLPPSCSTSCSSCPCPECLTMLGQAHKFWLGWLGARITKHPRCFICY